MTFRNYKHYLRSSPMCMIYKPMPTDDPIVINRFVTDFDKAITLAVKQHLGANNLSRADACQQLKWSGSKLDRFFLRPTSFSLEDILRVMFWLQLDAELMFKPGHKAWAEYWATQIDQAAKTKTNEKEDCAND